MYTRLFLLASFTLFTLVSSAATAQTKSVQELVETQYIHGFPRESASAITSSDIPYLAGVLKDTNKSKFWGNSIAALAMLDDKRVVPTITGFFVGLAGPLNPDEFRAAVAVPSALAAHSKDNPVLLGALTDMVEGKASALLPIQFHQPTQSVETSRLMFRKIAIFSLGYSPSPEALRYLELHMSKADPLLAGTYASAIKRARKANAAN